MRAAQNTLFSIDDVVEYLRREETTETTNDKGFNAAGWSAATKAEKLIWSVYELADKLGILSSSGHNPNKGAANTLRKDITYGHHVTELLSAASRNFSQGIEADSQEETDAKIVSTVLDTLRVIPRVSVGLLNKLSEDNASKILDFHKNISPDDSWKYESDKQEEKIKSQTDPSKLLESHKDFLQHNLDVNQDIVKAHEAKIATQLGAYQEAIEDKEARISELKSSGDPHSDSVHREILELKSEIDHVRSSMERVAATPDTQKVAEARAFLVEIHKQVDIADDMDTPYAKYGKAADGIASTLALGKYIADATAIDGESSAESIASQSNSLVYEFLGLLSAGLDFKNAAQFAKLSKALGAFGAVAGTAASSLGIADYARALNDPDLPDWQRDYIESEIGLQSATATLLALEGLLSSIQATFATGSKTASILGKAVPVIGALAAVAGSVNPAKLAAFKEQENRISSLEGSDDYSSDLLAELLSNSLFAEKGFYITATVVDALAGITGAILAASGVGAGAGIAVGLIGGVVSATIQGAQQARLEEIADRYAEKMRSGEDGNRQSIEDYFEESFDQKQGKLEERYEEFFNDLIADRYDEVFSFGSQTLTVSDLSLAAIAKTGGELGKTARHYFEKYSGQGHWDKESIELEAVKGADKIYLPDNGDGNNRYLTLMSPLMASGEEVLTREKEGKYKYFTSLEIKDLAGWEIIDQGESNTVFSSDNIVHSAQYASGKTLILKLAIDARGGNDTHLAATISTEFDGGAGEDTASYTGLENSELSSGLTVSGRGDQISVTKHFDKGTQYIRETIEQHTERHGKRKETIEYRDLSVGECGNEITVTDELKAVEILQTTDMADYVDLRGVDVLRQLFTFDGDDHIHTGDFLSLVAAGTGDDTIEVGKNIQTIFAENGDDQVDLSALKIGDLMLQEDETREDAIYIDGGKGQDKVKFTADVFSKMVEEYLSAKETELIAAQLTDLSTMDQDLGGITTMFRNILGKQPVLDALYLKDIEWFDYDLENQTLDPALVEDSPDLFEYRTAALASVSQGKEVLDRTYYLSEYRDIINHALAQDGNYEVGRLYAASVETYDANLSNADQLKAFSDGNVAQEKTELDGNVSDGDLAARQLKHVSGKIYLEAGRTYEFKENVDDYSSLYIDGQEVLSDSRYNSHASGQYVPQKSGFVTFDFYAYNRNGLGNYDLSYRVVGEDDDFTTLLSSARDPLLRGLINGCEDTYEGVYSCDDADALEAWVDSHGSRSFKRLDDEGRIEGSLTSQTIKHISGKIYLEAGETYVFRESVDDYALLKINGEKIIGDMRWNHSSSGSCKVSESGYYQFDFYAYNRGGPGDMKLEYKVEGIGDFTTIHTSDSTTTPDELNLDFSATSQHQGVNLIGSEYAEKMEGSKDADFLFGHLGSDVLTGAAGDDVLIGGDDADTFVFGRHSGHDIILESYDEDFEHNTLKLLDSSLSNLLFTEKDGSLIITDSSSPDWSITLDDYFGGDKGAQRLLDKKGSEMFLHQSDKFGDYSDLSDSFRHAYEAAISSDLIEQARQTFSPDNTINLEYL